jgi:hypothetical protein
MNAHVRAGGDHERLPCVTSMPFLDLEFPGDRLDERRMARDVAVAVKQLRSSVRD